MINDPFFSGFIPRKYNNLNKNYLNYKPYNYAYYSNNKHNTVSNKQIQIPQAPPPKVDKHEKNMKNDEEPIFELFGIKIYFDDILIICLIFFLFQEGVTDQFLFIALILLLLS